MKKLSYLSTIACLLFLVCCKKPADVKPEEPTETGAGSQEVMTTLVLKFKNLNNPSNTFDVKFRKLSGTNWHLDSMVLNKNTSYELNISILNETDLSNVKDVTLNIEKKSDFHQFYFEPLLDTDIANMKITYLNFDSNGKPYGSKMKIETKDNDTGALSVMLKHYTSLAEKNGNSAVGATDIDVEFPLLIKK